MYALPTYQVWLRHYFYALINNYIVLLPVEVIPIIPPSHVALLYHYCHCIITHAVAIMHASPGF